MLFVRQGTVENLQPGVNFLTIGDRDFIFYVQGKNITVCENLCAHKGGKFSQEIADIESDVVQCTRHGWRLSCSNLTYVYPPNCGKVQQKWTLESIDGGFYLHPPVGQMPWKLDAWEECDSAVNEADFCMTYFSHACVKVTAGSKVLFLDPWLTGPAFSRGWWLEHKPPPDWVNEVAQSDGIVLSHSHSDHMNVPTLAQVARKNPDIPIYIADLSVPVVDAEVEGLGFRDLRKVSIGKWEYLCGALRFMFLPDSHLEDLDTAIYIEYRGYSLLSTVDCAAPNGFVLPTSVDLLLTDFAAAASGFPSCMEGDDYPFKRKVEIQNRNRKAEVAKVKQLIDRVMPKFYIPYAGFFKIAHPSDHDVAVVNQKNSAKEVLEEVASHDPTVRTLDPVPGCTISIITKRVIDNGLTNDYILDDHAFDSWTKPLDFYRNHSAFLHFRHAAMVYFTWAGFKAYDLVLYLHENDETLTEECNSLVVDFWDLSFPHDPTTVQSSRPWEKVRARQSVLRKVMLLGKHWDELFIGFNCRVSRSPDVYHQRFWEHFLVKLPRSLPIQMPFSIDV